jgi:hypothetical protein
MHGSRLAAAAFQQGIFPIARGVNANVRRWIVARATPAEIARSFCKCLADALKHESADIRIRIRPDPKSNDRLLTIEYGAKTTLRVPQCMPAWSDLGLVRAGLTSNYGIDLAEEIFARLARGDQPTLWSALRPLLGGLECLYLERVALPVAEQALEAIERSKSERKGEPS